MYDIIIVGAGPAGCKTAELLGKEGIKVLILEEHSKIGKPVQCAGLISHRLFELSKVSKNILLNTVRKARFYSPNKNYLELKSKNDVFIVNREKLDKELSEKAKNNGVKIKTFTRFENYSDKKNFLKIKTSKGYFQTKLLIGADGPNSIVAHLSGLKLGENILVGLQNTVKSEFDTEAVELWFGNKISPDFFGWVIPENKNWARVGLGTSKKSMEYFKRFLNIRIGNKVKTKDNVSGVIRYGLIEKSVSDRIILVGDAASQVKPFSGGGVIYGLIGSKFASEACIKSIEEDRYDEKFLEENYDKIWKKKLSWPITKGLVMNKLIHSFSDKQLNFLFTLGQKSKLAKILEFLDMDLL
jgi:geranylgeranyl reductase family protein